MNRQALYMFKWKRSESRWWCIKISTIRGAGRYDDGILRVWVSKAYCVA